MMLRKRRVVNSVGFLTDGAWQEQDFESTETFGTDNDDLAVWELVGLPLLGTFPGGVQLESPISTNKTSNGVT